MWCLKCACLHAGDVAYNLEDRTIKQADSKTQVWPWEFNFQDFQIETCQEKLFRIVAKYPVRYSHKKIVIEISYKAIATAEATIKRVNFFQKSFDVRIEPYNAIICLLDRFVRHHRVYLLTTKNIDLVNQSFQLRFEALLAQTGFKLISSKVLFEIVN